MRVEPVGNVGAVRTVLVVNVARDRSLLSFVARVAIEIMAKALVCMRAINEATGVHGLLLSRSGARLANRGDTPERERLLDSCQTT